MGCRVFSRAVVRWGEGVAVNVRLAIPVSRACVVALERRAKTRSQARDHRDVDGIRLGDLGQRLAGGAALDGFLALIVRQFGLAAELDPLRLGSLAARAGAFPDEVALELGDRGQQRRQKPALR